MKVLLVHPILWSHYKAKVFNELSILLKSRKHDFLVLQIASTENNRKKLGAPDVNLHNYSYSLLFDGSYEDTTIVQRFKLLLSNVKAYNPNIMVLPGYYDLAVIALMIYAKVKGIKIIQSVDSTRYDSIRVGWKERSKSWILSWSDLIYCYGSMQIAYLKNLNIPDAKIHVRVQATDNERIREICAQANLLKPEGLPDKYFLYVGRLSKEKNLEMLIDVFQRLSSDWGLVIVGGGVQEDDLKSIVKQENIDRIFFAGGMNWKEVVLYYKFATTFVLPSISEPWGLVVNEAMICGLPVLVSRHCGCSKDLVVEGKNGFVFSPLDEHELYMVMNKIVAMSSEELSLYGGYSQQVISEFTPERSAFQMLQGIERFA